AIPNKRQARPLVGFLTRPEIEALLAAPNQQTWGGRRDHAFLLTALQTGLRLSEMTALRRGDLALGTGAHVRFQGKGRKERCTPLGRQNRQGLKSLAEGTCTGEFRDCLSQRPWMSVKRGRCAVPSRQTFGRGPTAMSFTEAEKSVAPRTSSR